MHNFSIKGETHSKRSVNLSENNFKTFRNAVLKRRLKPKEDYSALFFCPLFKDGESKSLEFDVEFLDKFSLNSS